MSDPFDLSGLFSVAELPPRSVASARPAPSYLNTLNPEQRAAVEATEGPVLVLAGAGTGKTRVLTTRLAHIIDQGRAYPSQILSVTFTNRAAREMVERVSKLLDRSVEGMWLGTFHAMAARILRHHAEAVGLRPDFTILDADDQVRLLKQLLQGANIDEKRWPARTLSIVIQRWKDRGLDPSRVGDTDGAEFANGRGKKLYEAYQERLKTVNAVDFGDLLLHNLTLFGAQPEVLAEYQRRFRYILVDEYQDTNVAQYLWLRLLAQGRSNICCVGDDDQSIYGWRGAEVGNILRFEEDFPGATVVQLERNYRSTGHILATASGLIAHNAGRLDKTLWTEDAAGEPIKISGVWDGDAEARRVGEEIERLSRKGDRRSQMAVLVRAGFQTRAFEERFLAIGLPYRVIGGLRFYERQEIRDAIAYIRVLMQPDDDLAFERIVNLPKRGLGDTALQAVHSLARARDVSLYRAAEALIETDEMKPKPRQAFADLLAAFMRWRAALGAMTHVELVERMLDESGYTEMWQKDKSPQAPGRLENLKELIAALEDFETLGAFLEHVSLVMDRDEGAASDMVNVMTLHSAKGLEFDTVFLPGWEEGLFPHQLALDEKGAAGLEEERRLAYVGLTRARRRVHILFAANRRVYNQWLSAIPSRFIDELPPDHIESDNELAARSAARQQADDDHSAGWRADRQIGPETAGRFGRSRAPQLVAQARPERADVETHAFNVGSRVFHQKFGYGRVRTVDGNKLEIAFDKAGTKKVIDSFVSAA
ncbi:MAG: DNA helicase II [Alphaproteobacteria bacterium]|nr:DNA helicase II [Alphaproteobacteria bacterium]